MEAIPLTSESIRKKKQLCLVQPKFSAATVSGARRSLLELAEPAGSTG